MVHPHNTPSFGSVVPQGYFAVAGNRLIVPGGRSLPAILDRKTGKEYDRYKGVKELMPFAKAVSAKSYDFDAEGNDTKTDYLKMMKIVVAAGYNDYVGIEYEGGKLSEVAGVHATKKLLLKVRDMLS